MKKTILQLGIPLSKDKQIKINGGIYCPNNFSCEELNNCCHLYDGLPMECWPQVCRPIH